MTRNSTPRKPSSKGHRRTRSDHATETAEDYVEAILEITNEKGLCRAVDLTRRFDVTHVTVNKTLKRLAREGLVVTEPYAPVSLTSKGKRMARSSQARHEVVYQFLLALGVDPATATSDSEGIEHHVSALTLQKMSDFVQQSRASGEDRS